MRATVFSTEGKKLATMSNLPNGIIKAVEDFNLALQEVMVDERGFDAVVGGKQFSYGEIGYIDFGRRYRFTVEQVELAARYGLSQANYLNLKTNRRNLES